MYRFLPILMGALLINHGDASGQITRIPDAPACPNCAIEWSHVTTLGNGQDAILGRPGHIARSPKGEYYVLDDIATTVRIFGRNGDLLGNAGRKGAGPGEFTDPRRVLVSPDGNLHVLDPGLNRRTVFTPTGHLITTKSMGLGTSGLVDVSFLPNGHLLLNRILQDAEGAGFALQEIDDGGNRIRLFSEGRLGPRFLHELVRFISVRKNGEIWSVRDNPYLIELYGVDSKVKKTLIRNVSWFNILDENESMDAGVFRKPPTSNVRGIWEDPSGLLWVIVNVTAATWKPGPSQEEWIASKGKMTLRGPYDVYDTIIDVIDPSAGRLVSSLRVKGYVEFNLRDGYFSSYGERQDGTPVVDIWRASLKH